MKARLRHTCDFRAETCTTPISLNEPNVAQKPSHHIFRARLDLASLFLQRIRPMGWSLLMSRGVATLIVAPLQSFFVEICSRKLCQ